MESENKTLTIGGKDFTLVQLDPWRRLTFVADLQKDFLVPLLKEHGEKDLSTLFSNDGIDVMALLSGFSSAVDGKILEKWVKRILMDGMVIYTRDDGQKSKLGFSEINKFFSNPTHILVLVKEVIVFNMLDIEGLMSSLQQENVGTAKVTEA